MIENGPKNQAGIGIFSGLLLLASLAAVAMFGFVSAPLYIEYHKVKMVMESVSKLPSDEVYNRKAVYDTFLRIADVNDLYRFNNDSIMDLVQIKKNPDTQQVYLKVEYSAEAHFFQNLYLTLKVNESMPIGS